MSQPGESSSRVLVELDREEALWLVELLEFMRSAFPLVAGFVRPGRPLEPDPDNEGTILTALRLALLDKNNSEES